MSNYSLDFDPNFQFNWDNRRPWILHNGTIYMGDPGTHHPDVALKHKFKYDMSPDEGDIYAGQVRAINDDLIPMVQDFYNKHFRDDDIANGRIRQSNHTKYPIASLDSYVERAKKAIISETPEQPIRNVASAITGSKWAYLNGAIRQGEFYPDLIWQLGKQQGLEDTDKLSNLVAVGDWPITDHNLAIGEWWQGHPQIMKSNVDRNVVIQALRALDKPV